MLVIRNFYKPKIFADHNFFATKFFANPKNFVRQKFSLKKISHVKIFFIDQTFSLLLLLFHPYQALRNITGTWLAAPISNWYMMVHIWDPSWDSTFFVL